MASYSADVELADQELVKCVVVGDSGVGKTRLICARACGTSYTLRQLTQTHIPTVWAIDHYRQDKEVLDKSCCVIDGANVTLRLWDTFGYHGKDRRFAYGRADVVLLCFSLVKPKSLRNVEQLWYPEIQKSCPGVPIILCGCQADLRYLYNDEQFLALDKGPFFKDICDDDIILPEVGRSVAQNIGAHYYESSVLTEYGIKDVFTNAIRAALLEKRRARFWVPQLKYIRKPTCQEPVKPPKPSMPILEVPPQNIKNDLQCLLHNQQFCDVHFICQGVSIKAHKICLVAAAPVFHDIFITSNKDSKHSHKEQSIISSHTNNAFETDSVKELLLKDDVPDPPEMSNYRTLNHPAFIATEEHKTETSIYDQSMTSIVTMNSEIKPLIFQHILQYLYTGCITETPALLPDVKQSALLLGFSDLVGMVFNIENNQGYLNRENERSFMDRRFARVKELILKKGLFADVFFELEDGVVPGNKALMIARCDMMAAMFSNNFLEGSAKMIPFPGVYKDTFVVLQEYLYTGRCPDLNQVDYIELLELANRLCLPHLLLLTEHAVANHLLKAERAGSSIVDEVLALLEPAQLHNASQLSRWCLTYLCTHYGTVYKKHYKTLVTLRSENREYLVKYRWPPLWYLKEVDHYDRTVREQAMRERPLKSINFSAASSRGCLCFSKR
ncbi:unnamed protein product [Owenia fusiformis]|uniref:Uncharacterized protein n=1 Tax=Owenia fusiformis TaxID=6347 RepID=A0A8J1T4G5_OWEFU|nr:unnamed protein product [Owenia fusiformis]